MRFLFPLVILVLLVGKLSGQSDDLSVVYERSDETVSYLLFDKEESGFRTTEAFRARSYDLAPDHPRLTLSGDFTGDGVHELAVFNDLTYTPNMNPAFTCSVVRVSRSDGNQFIPSGTWFSSLDTQLEFAYVSFSLAGDFNMDGLDDIALFYNDPSNELLRIYLLESSGSGFSEAETWYTVNRNEFNFTAVKFACGGDFNGNGKPDIAVLYNYFGTAPETKQSVFLFESDGSSFELLPAAYNGSKAAYDFSNVKFALPGDYNLDNYSDMALVMDDSLNNLLVIPVFEGSETGQLSPAEYISIPETDLLISSVLHAVSGNFAGDTATDLTLFYDHPATGSQEILVLESDLNSFKLPETAKVFDPASFSFADLTAVRSGSFKYQPMVSVTTWKENSRGAISFTFDDGYRGAFEHGGAELEAAGLKGTFYIFTDTTTIYDGELASTGLVWEYRALGHEIGSHTTNHSNLGFLTESGDIDSLEQVLSTSVELLNERFQQQTVSMSIPFGSFQYETLEHISRHFYSARSSQYGFNLATPYDFYALKSWPILSTTYPDYVDNLLATAEAYGTWLPLMYHDMVDEVFDEETEIYNYSRELFRETVQDAVDRDLWIDTHERIYKYIRERNALKIGQLDNEDLDAEPGHFSFEADDGLPDSIFNVELTLKIALPDSWSEDTVSVGPENGLNNVEVQEDSSGSFILYNWLPVSGISIHINDEMLALSGVQDRLAPPNEVRLSAVPNPFQKETIIRVSGTRTGNAYLIARDIHGQIVRKIPVNTGGSYSLAGENLAPGIYILQLIENGSQLGSLKLLKL
jgi:peptidoglycan/xylan/chitin deacetylase (PgdA/CDA1 family)